MKINREARQNAKKLFNVCLKNGQLDEANLRQAVTMIAAQKPRNYLAVLTRLKKLVEIEVNKRTVRVESASPLADRAAAVFAQVEQKFGACMVRSYLEDPALLGGMRIQIGSDVWDGSVRQRLQTLQQNLN